MVNAWSLQLPGMAASRVPLNRLASLAYPDITAASVPGVRKALQAVL
jgi:hypothetical protein